MNAARDEILARVRGAIEGAETVDVPRAYRTAGSRSPAETLDLLAERLADYRARVERCANAEVATRLPPGRLGVPSGLPEAWRPAGAVVDDGLSTAALDALDGVVTGCALAIAETGTLVLAGGEHGKRDSGRRALSLVPDLHVCVVRASQVVETVPEAFARLAGLERRPLTFVSGPSATSDIELKRVEGVHGPRTLVAILVEDA